SRRSPRLLATPAQESRALFPIAPRAFAECDSLFQGQRVCVLVQQLVGLQQSASVLVQVAELAALRAPSRRVVCANRSAVSCRCPRDVASRQFAHAPYSFQLPTRCGPSQFRWIGGVGGDHLLVWPPLRQLLMLVSALVFDFSSPSDCRHISKGRCLTSYWHGGM